MRRLLTVAVALGVIGVACVLLAPARPASASCVAGPVPLGTVEGVITADVSTGGFSQLFTLVADDGSAWTINVGTPKAKDVVVEDQWTGRVPQVGGRYRIVGLLDGKALSLNQCVPGSAVEVLAPPPSTVPSTVAPPSAVSPPTVPSTQATSPVGSAVRDWLVPVTGAGVLVVLSVALARRTRRR